MIVATLYRIPLISSHRHFNFPPRRICFQIGNHLWCQIAISTNVVTLTALMDARLHKSPISKIATDISLNNLASNAILFNKIFVLPLWGIMRARHVG
ncbi:NADH-ubiquinone oxidoreductase [Histoplasma ohiense]|nr:NADH-ubiquinone oxidoreductase [Histoplasma ohiense (nom. inval.)]